MALKKQKNHPKFEVLKILYREPSSKYDPYDKDEYSPSKSIPKSLIPELAQYASTLPFSYTGFVSIHFSYDDVEYTAQYGTFDQWSAHKMLIIRGQKAQFKLGNRNWFGHWQVNEVDYIIKNSNKTPRIYEPADFYEHDDYADEELKRDIVADDIY